MNYLVEMSQNLNGYRGTPHGSPPPNTNNDFTGLMGSLISPGHTPATPLQQAFNMYNPTTTWPNVGQGNYNFNVPFQGSPTNQDAWNQNGSSGYMALGLGEVENEDQSSLMVVDDTDILKNIQDKQQFSQNGGASAHTQATNPELPVRPGQLPDLATSSPLALPHPKVQGSIAPGPTLVTKSPMVNDSAARAAELRAKLLAKRSSTTASPRASPAVKKAELASNTQTSTLELHKNGLLSRKAKIEDASKQAPVQATAATKPLEKPTSKPQEQSQSKVIKDDEFEHLFAQARNAADTAQTDSNMTNGSHANGANVGKPPPDLPTNGDKVAKPVVSDVRPALQKTGGSSEMSEGEIHSGPSSPIVARPSPRNIETKEGKQDDQEKKEKLTRQNEVTRAYQPLKSTTQPTRDSTKTSPHMLDHSKPERLTSPKLSNKQLKQQAWKQRNGYATSHDTYPESRRDRDLDRDRNLNGRDDDRDSRRASTSQAFANPAQAERDARRRMSDDELRRLQRTEENARRAADYKKYLETQRAAASGKSSDSSKALSSPKEARSQETEPRVPQANKRRNVRNGSDVTPLRIDTQMPTVESAAGEQDVDVVMFSPTGNTVDDEDISDWLELTDYYDLAHREKRLTWFRKKRALDVQRAELEREEQMELQERSMLKRAQSVLPANIPSRATRRASTVHAKMPPPPLPLRETNSVGIKIKDAALSAGLSTSQTPITPLKTTC